MFRLTSISETYRFFLQNSHCKLIFLAICHDNGYVAELDKYRNDPTAREKTWLVDHLSNGRAFMDSPFRMVHFDHVFSTIALPLNRPSAPIPRPRSSYSSAVATPAVPGPAARSGHNSLSMPPPVSTSGLGTPRMKISPHGSSHNPLVDNLTPYYAPEVEAPASSDMVPVVSLSLGITSRPTSPSSQTHQLTAFPIAEPIRSTARLTHPQSVSAGTTPVRRAHRPSQTLQRRIPPQTLPRSSMSLRPFPNRRGARKHAPIHGPQDCLSSRYGLQESGLLLWTSVSFFEL